MPNATMITIDLADLAATRDQDRPDNSLLAKYTPLHAQDAIGGPSIKHAVTANLPE
jgi:hypothetical protein